MHTENSSTAVLEPPAVLPVVVGRPQVAVELNPAPPWLNRGHIPGLDGVRAIAVILVLLTHSMQTPGFPEWPVLTAVAAQGAVGVDIFFVISGFLITTLLLREFERFGKVDLKRFYLRRTLRIIPAYVGLLAVVYFFQRVGKFHLEARDWIGALTYTTNFLYHPTWELGHTWSLSVEEHFYLLWPFVLYAWGPRGGRWTAIGCIVSCWAIRCVIALVLPRYVSPAQATVYSSLAETWTFTRLDTISMGCLVAVLSREVKGRAWLDRCCRGEVLGIALCLLCLSLAMSSSGKFILCVGYTLNAACIAVLLWGLIRSSGWMAWILNNRLLCVIGVGSYSIYLWQQLFIHPRLPGWIHAFPQNVLLAFGAAWLSYWLIERPLLAVKDRLAA